MRTRLYTLSNGLRVVLDPIRSIESLTIGAWIGVGSRHEPANLSGLAHLLEHMVFKGTPSRSSYALVAEVEGRGGAINAYTSRENTAYYCRLLKDDLALGLNVLSDIIQNAELKPAELERERGVIIQEIHQAADTPDDIVFDHFQETAFPNQGLGNPVLGREEVLKSVGAAPLKDFRDRAYGAANTTLVVSGKFEMAEAEALIERAFASLPEGQRSEDTPAQYKGGQSLVTRPELEQAHLLIGWEGAPLEGQGYYAQHLIATMLGGGMSSRLFQQVREVHGLAYSVSAFLSSFHDSGLFGCYAGIDPGELDSLLPLMAKTSQELLDEVNADELERAKIMLKASLLMSQESTLSRAESFAGQVQVFGELRTTDALLAPLEQVGLGEIRTEMKRLFSGPMTTAMVGPNKALPSQSHLEDMFRVA